MGVKDLLTKPIDIKQTAKVIKKSLPRDLISTYAKTDVPEEPEDISDLPDIQGIDYRAGIAYSGSKELLKSLLGDFYTLIDMKASKIEKCLADGMIRDFTVEVHALKSTARMIGAADLSEMFKELEDLGNAENISAINEKIGGVLQKYRSYKAVLSPFAKAKESAKEEVSADRIKETLADIKDAVDNFDLDRVDAGMKELETYRLPDDCQPLMESLRAYVADVAMEEIIETVTAMSEKM